MSEELRRSVAPEADLPTPDPDKHRPMHWPWIVLLLAAALILPLLVSRCTFSGRGGPPTPRVSTVAQSAVVAAAPDRLSLEQLQQTSELLGREAALASFEQRILPYDPAPEEWTLYVLLAQDLRRLDASERGIVALANQAVEPWRVPMLQARQMLAAEAGEVSRDEILDQAYTLLVAAAAQLGSLPETAGRHWGEALLRGVADDLLQAERPREVARLLPERIAAQSADLTRSRLFAIMRDGRTIEAESWLETGRLPLDDFERRRFWAEARWLDGRAQAAGEMWDLARVAAERREDWQDWWLLTFQALSHGDLGRSRAALVRLLPAVDAQLGRDPALNYGRSWLRQVREGSGAEAAAREAQRLVEALPGSEVARLLAEATNWDPIPPKGGH